MSSAELRQLLRELTRVEGAGDIETARRLRSEILQRRTAERQAQAPDAPLESLDHALRERIATDLERQGKHAEALAVLAPARDDARQQQNRRRSVALDLLAAQSAVGLLDLELACELLAHSLDADLDNAEATLVSAAGLDLLPAPAPWEDNIVGRAYVSLARLWAAQGRLRNAITTLRRLERLFESGPVDGVSRRGVRSRIAELILARGEFAEFDDLAQKAGSEGASDDPVWRILCAERLQLSGHLSGAEQMLGMISENTPANLVEEARWLRANILGTLNHFDEAGRLMKQELSAKPEASDWLRLKDLLDARRAFQVSMGVMPLPGGRKHPAGRPSARSDVYQEPQSLERRYEEVFAEWNWRANEVLLALHSGARASTDLLQSLRSLVEAVDSPLMAAKHLVIESLVDYYRGEFASALDRAEAAHKDLTRLDCPTDALTVCQVRRWVIAKLGLGTTDRGIAAQEDAERTFEIVRERLSPGDRIVGLLNRWSIADEKLQRAIVRAPLKASGFWGEWSRRFRTRAAVKMLFGLQEWADVGGNSPVRPPEEDADGPVAAAMRNLAIRSARAPIWAGVPLLSFPAEFLPKDAAVIYYVSLPDRLEIFLCDRWGFRRVQTRVRATRAALWEAVREATGLLHADHGRWAEIASQASVVNLAALLGIGELSRLVAPSVRRLFVIPDNAVVHVPFGALPLDGKPLVCRFATAFFPRPRWTSPRAASKTPSLAVALDIETTAGPPLPGVVPEIDLVKRTNPDACVLRGRDATREAVLQALGVAESVHFATHGRFDAQQPHDTALAVADGWVSVQDLQMRVSRALRLAFLGACWGANTYVLPGRELISLPVGLLDGGAHEVVASLWPVLDEPSVKFASTFYRAYRAYRGDAARAVAWVQRRWWQERPMSEWASYVAYASGIVPGRAGRALLFLRAMLRRCAAAVRETSRRTPGDPARRIP